MATGTEAKIHEALCQHLETLVLSPVMPIAWPGVSFEPPADGSGYLRVGVFPNGAQQTAVGTNSPNRHVGILQVDVIWPKNEGEVQPKERADLIIAHFKRGTVISASGLSIRVDQPPSMAGALPGEKYTQIPLRVSYLADAPNT